MKHLKLFENWGENEEGLPIWKGNPSKNFSHENIFDDKYDPFLIFKKDGKKYKIKYGDWGSDWDEAKKDLMKLGKGWRIPTLEELEYIDQLLQDEGKDWEYDYAIDFKGDFWSNERAFDDRNKSMYVWNFDKHTSKYLDPRGRSASFLYIKELN